MKNNSSLTLRDIVLEIPGIIEFPGLLNAWHWTVAGGRFNFVLVTTYDGQHALQVSTRDMFNAELVRASLAFALQNESAVCAANPIAVLSGFSSPDKRFDTVIAVAPVIHELHKAERPLLHDATFRIFPAHHCEFSGRETSKEAMLRIAKMIDPANLKRDPQPLVRLRYLNTKTKGRTLGKNRGIDSPKVLISEIKKLVNALASFVEFENYLGEIRKVTWQEDGYVLWNGDESKLIELPELLDGIQRFLVG